jgi:Animal haem peroxidase
VTQTRFLWWIAEKVDRSIGWWRLPTPLGILVLVGLRDQLRADNLYGTGRGPLDRPNGDDPYVGSRLTARTLNGTYNDLNDPLMGSVGSRFGRNVPLTHANRDDRILEPSPRRISESLFKRTEFRPATTLNLLAAAWIQFEVHDWFSHSTDASNLWSIPLDPSDPWREKTGEESMTIRRTSPDPSQDPQGPLTCVTQDTHWWDGSQIYGNTRDYADALRMVDDKGELQGKLNIDGLGLAQREKVDQYLKYDGPTGNFWVGLAILHSLFMREHNAICDRLAAQYPDMSEDDLYLKARLVNVALMAKIHTTEWTPAIIANPTTVFGMRADWFGLFGDRFRRCFGRITSSDTLQGIPGSPTDHHGVPYSLTEEFVAVYRMHSMLPDDLDFYRVKDGESFRKYKLTELTMAKLPGQEVGQIRQRLSELEPMENIFYSFGISHPGAITLHNFPNTLRDFDRQGTRIDLAAIDILRDRERGVPRYNEFRRLFRLKPASTFEELTGDSAWAQELREIYRDVEQVDLMVGLHAEPKPPGFGFSDTAFRVFILMATRRLQSDRFFTNDFRPEVYTRAGMDWVNNNTLRTVLLRHFPSLEPALRGVKNLFAPWTAVTDNTLDAPPQAKRKFVEYRKDLESQRPDEDEVITKIIDVLHQNNKWTFRKYKHAIRDAHAKSHGILQGKLTVDDLKGDPDLQQGLFAKPAEYDVIARLSSTAGAIRNDQLRGIRGLGIKVLGVEGTRALTGDEAKTQDFLLVTHREFPFADVHAYYRNGMWLAWLLARLPNFLLSLFIDVAVGADRLGIPLPATVALFTRPNNHILGETFYSSAPLRYGKYVAKIEVAPSSPEVRALENVPVSVDAGDDAHTKEVVEFFETEEAKYELRVQLCTDSVAMPIEDATVAWSETASPHRKVATITFPSQNPYSDARRDFGDDVLSFNSWRALEDHRPLGSINRLKLRVYKASSQFRHEMNNVAPVEPSDITQLPGYDPSFAVGGAPPAASPSQT